jgi:hypothetical protein
MFWPVAAARAERGGSKPSGVAMDKETAVQANRGKF